MIYIEGCISLEGVLMQVGKWGNSLAVRLPAAIVEALDLKEGDDLVIEVVGTRTLRVERDRSREEASAILDALAKPLPPGFRFSREEVYERDAPAAK
jgi:antitoxin MazE